MTEAKAALSKLQRAYAAWHDSKGGSVDVWLDLMADDVEFRSLADGQSHVPFTKARTSRNDVAQYLADLTKAFAMDHMTIERYVADGDTIVAIGSTAWRCKATEKLVDTPIVNVWRFAGGKVIAFQEFYDTKKLIDAASA